MKPRYHLVEGSPGGERILGRKDDPVLLLQMRDDQRDLGQRLRVFMVIDTDAVDVDSSGEVEWCGSCRRTAVSVHDDACDACEAGEPTGSHP